VLRWFKTLMSGGAAAAPCATVEAPFRYTQVRANEVASALSQPSTDATSVLVGNRAAFEALLELPTLDAEISDAQIVSAGLALNLDQWLAEQAQVLGLDARDVRMGKPRLITPFAPTRTFFFQRASTENFFVAHLPVQNSWQAPAFLRLGGWNEQPEPHVMVAFLHRWQHRYGAQLITVTTDVMEFSVAKPPSDADDMALFREHCCFCPDLLDQGTLSPNDLLASLSSARHWHFWWD
jgi:hypothetical protein